MGQNQNTNKCYLISYDNRISSVSYKTNTVTPPEPHDKMPRS